MLTYCLSLIKETRNQSKFETIYYSYRKQMYYVAFGVTKDSGNAEDAVQEALIGIAQNIDHICTDDERRLRCYVLTAAKMSALKIERKLKPIREAECCSTDTEEWNGGACGPVIIDRKMEDDCIRTEAIKTVVEAIRALPFPYAEVLTLKYVHGLENSEIAEVMGDSLTMVYQWVSRGKKKLTTLLKGKIDL